MGTFKIDVRVIFRLTMLFWFKWILFIETKQQKPHYNQDLSNDHFYDGIPLNSFNFGYHYCLLSALIEPFNRLTQLAHSETYRQFITSRLKYEYRCWWHAYSNIVWCWKFAYMLTETVTWLSLQWCNCM